MRLGLAALVLDRKRLPQALAPLQRNAVLCAVKLHHIAFAGYAERGRIYPHGPHDEQVAAAFRAAVVRLFVQDGTVRRAVVFRPLVLHMDERPLTAAECEVLDAGELEKIGLGIDYPSTLQVTPFGRSASSTVMV